MRSLAAAALFCLLLLPACPWAQNQNHDRELADRLSVANVSDLGFAIVQPTAIIPSTAILAPVAMVAPVPPTQQKENPNPWTQPFASRRFVAANSIFLFSWMSDIEGTHFCLVRRTCIEGNHAIQGYPHPTRAQLYASTPWEIPAVLASSYLSHVVLPKRWKWLSYVPPVLFGGMHAYYGEQGFKRGFFDSRIAKSSTSPTR